MNFLKTLGAWAVFTCVPPLILYLREPLFRRSDVFFLLPFLLIPFVGSIALWSLAFVINTPTKGWAYGVGLGGLQPILGGLFWMELFPGFESQPAIFLGALMITVPSAAGGGLAGWLRVRLTQ